MGEEFSECGNRGRAAVVTKGDTLLFWSMKPGGELDPAVKCRVSRRERRRDAMWIHKIQRPNGMRKITRCTMQGPAPETCKDTNAVCADGGERRMHGEPGYMVSSCVSCRQCVWWRDGTYTKPELT